MGDDDTGIDTSIHYIDFAASIITLLLFLISFALYCKNKKKENVELENIESNVKELVVDKDKKLLELRL